MSEQQVWGFTGTRSGMTRQQLQNLIAIFDGSWVARIRVDKLVHGMAPGADAEANTLARLNSIPTKGWPASPESAKYVPVDEIEAVKPPLERDGDIAREGVAGLIACPFDDEEVTRSGTWATVRRARKLGRRIVIIKRDGTIVEEPGRDEKFDCLMRETGEAFKRLED